MMASGTAMVAHCALRLKCGSLPVAAHQLALTAQQAAMLTRSVRDILQYLESFNTLTNIGAASRRR